MLKKFMHKGLIEAGCDEAGRGCLAGPVFAAAVILPTDLDITGLNDSKKINVKNRLELRAVIIEKAIAYSVQMVGQEEIDQINILNASIKAMHKAVDQLVVRPQHLLIDGNRFKPYLGISHTCVIKGDGKYASIAAASILAKTYRDEYMEQLDIEFPVYKWQKNKGYPTKEHREAILEYGLTTHHRRSFRVKV